jgi:YD repeat-containing protein
LMGSRLLGLGRVARAALVVVVGASLLVAPGQVGAAAAAPVAAAAAAKVARPVPYVVPPSSQPLHGRKTVDLDMLRLKPWRPQAPKGGWSPAGAIPPRTPVVSPAATAAGHVGVTDLFAAPGDVIGDTAWIVYFNVPEQFSALSFTFFDAATNASIRFTGPGIPAFGPSCDQRTLRCFTLTSSLGWPLVDGHLYYATVTVFYSDGTSVTSGRSNSAPAHKTPVPPALPTAQTIGCSVCDSSAGRTAIGQILRGDPVNTATGAYEETVHDLSMPSFGIPFDLTRTYSSISTAVGSIGSGWAFEYDMRMIGTSANPVFQDSTGAQITFTRQPDGTYTAPPGVRSRLATPPRAFRPYTLTTPDQRVLRFLDNGRLASIQDRRGHGLRFDYDLDGNLDAIRDAAGRVVTVATINGRVARVTLPDDRAVVYGYAGDDLTSVTYSDGGETRYEYDSAHRLTSATDANEHRMVLNVYDPATGRVNSQTDAAGKVTTFTYDPDIQATLTTDPDGKKHVDGYMNNVLVITLDGNANETTYTYDGKLNLAVVTDPLGNRIPMTYDAAGNIASRTAPDGSYTEQATYDTHNMPLTRTDGLGRTTVSEYNQFGELTSTTGPLGKTAYTYNDQGLIETVTDLAMA